MRLRCFWLCVGLTTACSSGGDPFGPDSDDFEECYARTALEAVPSSHPELGWSPSAGTDGLAGTFDNAEGDRLTVHWDGNATEVVWLCADDPNVPQSSNGDPPFFELNAQVEFNTADGEFAEALPATITVRESFDPDDPEGEPVRVSAGGNLAIGTIAGSFQPREHTDREVDRVHWGIEYAAGRWALRLTMRGAGGGDTQPLYMRTVAF